MCRDEVEADRAKVFALGGAHRKVSVQDLSGGIFISYRRDQASGWAGRLYDQLAKRFGERQVFMDVDSIEPGLDFREVIVQAVSRCIVLLVIIGPRWLTVTDRQGGRRLDDSDDLVRLEVEAALARNVRIIPVLIDGAMMPGRRDLPESMATLARRNAFPLRHESFRPDYVRLEAVIERLSKHAQVPDVAQVPKLPARRPRWPWSARPGRRAGSGVLTDIERSKEEADQARKAASRTRPIRTIMFACDAGMGSSAMGASVLRNKIKKAGFADVSVVNVAIANLVDDADLIVTHQDLTPRARDKAPSARHVSVDNFMNSPKYDEIVEELKVTNVQRSGA